MITFVSDYSLIMTERQRKILDTALQLFANKGFDNTSTAAIAKKAEVSEGLIFRHFKNKHGLLNALMEDVETRINIIFAPVIAEKDPPKIIQRFISIPFEVDAGQYDFWKLQYKLKWQPEYNNPSKMKPVADKLTGAFEKLGYANPDKEALMLIHLLDSIATETLKGNINEKDKDEYRKFLLKKYLQNKST